MFDQVAYQCCYYNIKSCIIIVFFNDKSAVIIKLLTGHVQVNESYYW
jgi:hypothetical protein